MRLIYTGVSTKTLELKSGKSVIMTRGCEFSLKSDEMEDPEVLKYIKKKELRLLEKTKSVQKSEPDKDKSKESDKK